MFTHIDERVYLEAVRRGWLGPEDRDRVLDLRQRHPDRPLLDLLLEAGHLLQSEAAELRSRETPVTDPDGTETPGPLPGKTFNPAVLARLQHRTQSTGRYEYRRSLGRGGMGEVLEVVDPSLGRPVALKRLPGSASLDPELRQRFLREAKITAHLAHPNIVPVHELATDQQGDPYYTMKVIGGRTLAEILAAEKNTGGSLTSLLRNIQVFLKVCDALAFAHSHGVIHRDLKPSNIMVGEFGEVLVIDWGLAKGLGEAAPDAFHTQVGAVMGTPGYMSPEQAIGCGAEADARTDIYSLGVILYEILAGKPAFDAAGVNRLVLLKEIVEGTFPAPSQAAPEREIPEQLEAIVMRAMARHPRDRYPSVPALKEAIEGYLAGQTITALTGRPRRGTPFAPMVRTEPEGLASPCRASPSPWWRRERTLRIAGLALVLTCGILIGHCLRHAGTPEENSTTRWPASEPVPAAVRSLFERKRETLRGEARLVGAQRGLAVVELRYGFRTAEELEDFEVDRLPQGEPACNVRNGRLVSASEGWLFTYYRMLHRFKFEGPVHLEVELAGPVSGFRVHLFAGWRGDEQGWASLVLDGATSPAAAQLAVWANDDEGPQILQTIEPLPTLGARQSVRLALLAEPGRLTAWRDEGKRVSLTVAGFSPAGRIGLMWSRTATGLGKQIAVTGLVVRGPLHLERIP